MSEKQLELEKKQNQKIHVGMVSSYLQLIEGKMYNEVLRLQQKHGKKHHFLIPPVDIDTGDINSKDVSAMLEHFIDQEDYKKCAKIKNFLDTHEIDWDGLYYLPNLIYNVKI